MRLVFLLVCLLGSAVGNAMAQNTPVYNSTSYSSSGSKNQKSTIYNSRGSSSSAPISIKSMLNNKGQSSSRDSRVRAKTPYNFGGGYGGSTYNRSSLSITPAQIKAKQKADRQKAKDRAVLARQQREQRQAALKKQDSDVSARTSRYKSQFQDNEDQEKTTTRVRQRRSTYTTTNKDTSFVPAPVFNRVN